MLRISFAREYARLNGGTGVHPEVAARQLSQLPGSAPRARSFQIIVWLAVEVWRRVQAAVLVSVAP